MYREASVFYFNALFFWCFLFLKNKSTPGLEPTMSFKINLRNTFFQISLNSLEFYLSPKFLMSFLWFVYSTMCGKKISIYGVHIPRKCIESVHFYSCSTSPLKTPDRSFWKSVSSKAKGVKETMICFIKIQSKNMKVIWKISLFIFCMISNFSKCDGFTVL